jgi:hypothetical protein
VGALALVPAQAFAANAFDGRWQVRITAENGHCRNYTVPIQVRDGQVFYSGPFNAKASGKIRANGGLSVSFAHNNKVVNASGSLRDRAGSGSWMSPTQSCAGSWVARKG